MSNSAFCFRELAGISDAVSEYIKIRNYPAAVAGLDRVCNGLVVLQNTGKFNCRSYLSLFSLVEGLLIAQLDNANQEMQRQNALQALEDARDFARSDSLKEAIVGVISAYYAGEPIQEIVKNVTDGDFSQWAAEQLRQLSGKLREEAGQSVYTAAAQSGKKKSSAGRIVAWALVILLVLGGIAALNIWMSSRTVSNVPVITPSEETTSAAPSAPESEEESAAAPVSEPEIEETSESVSEPELVSEPEPEPEESNLQAYPELTEDWAWELMERDLESQFLSYYFSMDGIVDWDDTYSYVVNPEVNWVEELPSAYGIHTVEDLKQSLSRHFTESYIQEKFFTDPDQYFVSANGKLYFMINWGMGGSMLFRDTLTIEESGDGKYKVGIVAGHDVDTLYGYSYYEVVYDDGVYKVASQLY